jgi:hypothetical protein
MQAFHAVMSNHSSNPAFSFLSFPVLFTTQITQVSGLRTKPFSCLSLLKEALLFPNTRRRVRAGGEDVQN